MRDDQLLQNFAETGDTCAFEALVEKYLGLVSAAANRRCENHQLAEEAVQNTFAILARKAGKLSSHPTVGGWLHRTVMYEAGRLRRSENNRQRKMKAYAETQDGGIGAGEPVIDHEAVDLALDRLQPVERDVLILRFFEGRSFSEIGSLLGKSEAAVQKRGERALQKMRTHLGRSGGGLAAHFSSVVPATRPWASEVAEASLAVSRSLPKTVLLTHTLSMLSYPKIIAIAAVFAIAVWSVRQELQERSRLLAEGGKTVAGSAAPTPLATVLPGVATPAQETPRNTGGPVPEPEAAPAEIARRAGTAIAEIKREEARLADKYRGGAPSDGGEALAEYTSDLDQLMRLIAGAMENGALQSLDSGLLDDPGTGAIFLGTVLSESLGIEPARSEQLIPILENGIRQRHARGLRVADQANDRDSWHEGMRELTDEVLLDLRKVLTEEEMVRLLQVHGESFFHSINIGFITSPPASE